MEFTEKNLKLPERKKKKKKKKQSREQRAWNKGGNGFTTAMLEASSHMPSKFHKGINKYLLLWIPSQCL